jgi:hypothetical protein
VIFEYAGPGTKKKQLIYEQRIWSPYVQEGHENGNAFYGTKGMMILGKQSGNCSVRATARENELAGDAACIPRCIKSGGRPNADIESGHLSTTLAHLGNIATRVGRVLHFDPAAEQFTGDDEANRLIRRTYR